MVEVKQLDGKLTEINVKISRKAWTKLDYLLWIQWITEVDDNWKATEMIKAPVREEWRYHKKDKEILVFKFCSLENL